MLRDLTPRALSLRSCHRMGTSFTNETAGHPFVMTDEGAT